MASTMNEFAQRNIENLKQMLRPHQIHSKIVFIATTGILIVLLIVFAMSNIQTKCRLDVLEYQNKLLVDEVIGMAGFHQAIQRKIQQTHRTMHLASLQRFDKITAELDEMKRLTNRDDYFDRSGRSDFALETSGGKILSIGKTRLVSPNRYWSLLFGFSSISDYFKNGPRRVIQPTIYPGECFAFVGHGEIVIKLIRSAFIDSVSIEHILPQMSPDGYILNAPHDFSVFGMANEDDANGIHFGDFQYDINKMQPLQTFQLNENASDSAIPIVRIEIKNNHGDPDSTCVYRIRVHGSLTKMEN